MGRIHRKGMMYSINIAESLVCGLLHGAPGAHGARGAHGAHGAHGRAVARR